MILNEILPEYMHFKRLKFSGALEEFSITSQLLGSKMQKSNLDKNKDFECSFFRI